MVGVFRRVPACSGEFRRRPARPGEFRRVPACSGVFRRRPARPGKARQGPARPGKARRAPVHRPGRCCASPLELSALGDALDTDAGGVPARIDGLHRPWRCGGRPRGGVCAVAVIAHGPAVAPVWGHDPGVPLSRVRLTMPRSPRDRDAVARLGRRGTLRRARIESVVTPAAGRGRGAGPRNAHTALTRERPWAGPRGGAAGRALHPLERHRDRAPAAQAESGQSVAASAATELVEQGRDHARAGGADGVP